MADQFSGYPFAERLNGTTTDKVIAVLLRWFQDFGFPRGMRTDNGPQFRDRFAAFCREHYIVLDNSSPYHSQSNGLAEAAVKNIKFLLEKCKANDEDFRSALLQWRSCPRANGFSPSEAFFGRRLRGKLPMLSTGFGSFDLNSYSEIKHQNMDAAAVLGPQGLHSELDIGQSVLLQDPISKRWDTTWTVSEKCGSGRSYIISDEYGRKLTRNRRFLRPRTSSPGFSDDPDSDFEVTVNSPAFKKFLQNQQAQHIPRRSPRFQSTDKA